jgi:hypothetical protein
MEQIINTLSALLAIVVAITTVSILVLQYLLARQRWRLDLYDKRYPLYSATMEYLSHILHFGTTDSEHLVEFQRAYLDRELLFDKTIREYMRDLYIKGEQLRMADDRLKGPLPGTEAGRVLEERKDLAIWFEKQFEVANRLFGAYIRITRK